VIITRSPYRYLIIGYAWEIAYPATIGIVAALVTWVVSPWAFACAKKNGIHLENMYGAVAGVFAIVAGFLASFYGSVQAIADTRLRRVAKTPFFRRFISQIKEATIAGFGLSVISIPFIVIGPDTPDWWFTRLSIAVWLGLSVYALAAFVRVGRWLFAVFERAPPDDSGAG
jgi:hypothetical protein